MRLQLWGSSLRLKCSVAAEDCLHRSSMATRHGQKPKSCFQPALTKGEALQVRQITNAFQRITHEIPGWDKEKQSGLMRKTCTMTLLEAGASKAEVDFHLGWDDGTQPRNYARESLQVDMKPQAKAAGFARDFHYYLGRADIAVPKAWYDALMPV